MKLRIFVLTLMAVAALADDTQPAKKKTTATKASTKAHKPPTVQPLTIPEGAVEVGPYVYRYTDPHGKGWLYHKTPFGVSREEDKPAPAASVARAEEDKARLIETTSAVEDGESIRFERVSPFGRMKWQRKKSELNEVERAVWDRELKKRGGLESASKD